MWNNKRFNTNSLIINYSVMWYKKGDNLRLE